MDPDSIKSKISAVNSSLIDLLRDIESSTMSNETKKNMSQIVYNMLSYNIELHDYL